MKRKDAILAFLPDRNPSSEYGRDLMADTGVILALATAGKVAAARLARIPIPASCKRSFYE
jgi:hypothetical protein